MTLATQTPARIAILGILLESHRRAPPTSYRDFEQFGLWRGEAIHQLLALGDDYGFAGAMSRLRSWEPVPILVATAEAGGPAEHSGYLRLVEEIEARLAAAGPLDAVYIDAHGAGMTTELDDMDGDYFRRVRALVGDIPIVATIDLHANVSDEMVESVDAIVSMRTNPHVDIPARRDEAAGLLHRMLAGERLHSALVRLPLVTPQVTQLTAPGEPLGDLMAIAETRMGGPIANVSLAPGFAFGDSRHNGFAVLASAWSSSADAEAAARDMAQEAWQIRHRFERHLTTLAQAVELAREAAAGDRETPMILADVADNPGGGGRGNTMFILSALVEAGVTGVAVGPVYDCALAEQCFAAGVGATIRARFNSAEDNSLSHPFEADAEVVALNEGQSTFTAGIVRGHPFNLGRCALLRIGGIEVAIQSLRHQTLSPDMLAHCGVDLGRVRCFVVKSRGHFRAGFAGLVRDGNIFEVDVPGLTSPNLLSLEWTGLVRPVFPLDRDTVWAP